MPGVSRRVPEGSEDGSRRSRRSVGRNRLRFHSPRDRLCSAVPQSCPKGRLSEWIRGMAAAGWARNCPSSVPKNAWRRRSIGAVKRQCGTKTTRGPLGRVAGGGRPSTGDRDTAFRGRRARNVRSRNREGVKTLASSLRGDRAQACPGNRRPSPRPTEHVR